MNAPHRIDHLAKAEAAWGDDLPDWVRALAGARAVGLDHGSAQAGLALAGVEVTPELWERVRMIERGALDAMSEEWL